MLLRQEVGARPEVFMVHRPPSMKFAADVFVFPGGTIRPDDGLAREQAALLGLDPAPLSAVLKAYGDPLAETPDGGLQLWIAAIRELFEEAGVLLASEADGSPLDLGDAAREARFAALRGELQTGRLSLFELARQERLIPRMDLLVYFSRWITPTVSPRRYDTRFFVAELPPGQTALHCAVETTTGLWLEPSAALRRSQRGEMEMMFVTAEHVRRLGELGSLPELFAFAQAHPVRPVQPLIHEGEAVIPEEQQPW